MTGGSKPRRRFERADMPFRFLKANFLPDLEDTIIFPVHNSADGCEPGLVLPRQGRGNRFAIAGETQ